MHCVEMIPLWPGAFADPPTIKVIASKEYIYHLYKRFIIKKPDFFSSFTNFIFINSFFLSFFYLDLISFSFSLMNRLNTKIRRIPMIPVTALKKK